MCGFAGFSDYGDSLKEEQYLWKALVQRMARRISHRGPDDSGAHVSAHCALAHARLAVMDPQKGKQPFHRRIDQFDYVIAYNGEVYNAQVLREELKLLGYTFKTNCDTEVVLTAYIHYGLDCIEKLNGIFAFVIDDPLRQRTVLVRDRFGVKPLFYTDSNNRMIMASEIKALFEYPGINPEIGREGLCEIFGLGPARTPGCGVFNNIHELLPGHYAIHDRDGFRAECYYTLRAHPHADSYEETVAHVRALLIDTVERQLMSDVPLCTFLSGGLDSSIVTAIAAKKLKEQGKVLDTFSFEFTGNDIYFSPSAFQPDRDEAWSLRVSELLGTCHTKLVCSNEELFYALHDAMVAKDLPGMADIDASLLHFCCLVKMSHDVVLCGECADELFAGYPWFHRPDMFHGTAFPWSDNLDTRSSLLKPDILAAIHMEDYVDKRLHESLEDVPVLETESPEEMRMRQISYLNIKWFMATLLDRKDRCSMANGLEVRVPYADHRIADYLFNTPWAFKCPDGVEKGLLRDAAKGLLPEDVLFRKKSPYPKTHNPGYEAMLKRELRKILTDGTQPIHKILSEDTAAALLTTQFDYGAPWFGQLMAGPQLLAYLIQINDWMNYYDVKLTI